MRPLHNPVWTRTKHEHCPSHRKANIPYAAEWVAAASGQLQLCLMLLCPPSRQPITKLPCFLAVSTPDGSLTLTIQHKPREEASVTFYATIPLLTHFRCPQLDATRNKSAGNTLGYVPSKDLRRVSLECVHRNGTPGWQVTHIFTKDDEIAFLTGHSRLGSHWQCLSLPMTLIFTTFGFTNWFFRDFFLNKWCEVVCYCYFN